MRKELFEVLDVREHYLTEEQDGNSRSSRSLIIEIIGVSQETGNRERVELSEGNDRYIVVTGDIIEITFHSIEDEDYPFGHFATLRNFTTCKIISQKNKRTL